MNYRSIVSGIADFDVNEDAIETRPVGPAIPISHLTNVKEKDDKYKHYFIHKLIFSFPSYYF